MVFLESRSAESKKTEMDLTLTQRCVTVGTFNPCADPESFVRGWGGATVTFFVVDEGRIQIALSAGHHRPASETPFKWRFAGVLVMAQH